MSERIAIVGASVRAAAASAVRGGFEVVAADLFADADLCEIADATQIDDYPQGFVSWMKSLSPTPIAWLYTGALENHPDLVDELATITPLWGNAGDVLRRARSPWLLAETLSEHGLRFPEVRASPSGLRLDGSWLAKTGRGGNGSGVANLFNVAAIPSGAFFQQRVAGVSCSAVYIATGGRSQLLGIVRQLVGETWLHAREFQYCGAIAPWPVAEEVRSEISRIGDALTNRYDLHGVFGVDLMIDRNMVWTIEVNPRVPSSAEIVERATGINMLEAHASACCESTLPSVFLENRSVVCGKAILFAREATEIVSSLNVPIRTREVESDWRALADLPRVGTHIERAHPVITIFADGASPDEVAACLKGRVALVEQQLYPH